MDVDRRTFLVSAAASSLLAGCSGDRYSALGAASDALLSDIRETSISSEEAARIPYASLGLRLDGGAEMLAVLSRADGAVLRWSVGRDATLLTRGGRIVGWYKSAAIMIDSGAAGDMDPVARSGALPVLPAETRRQVDFPEEGRFGVTLRGRLDDRGDGPVIEQTGTRRLVEIGRCDGLDWDFENEFQFDMRNARCIASRQYVHPNLGPIEWRELRPYAGSAKGP